MLVFQCLSAQLPFSEDHEDKHHHKIIQNIAHSLAVSYDLMQRKEIVKFERFGRCFREPGVFSLGEALIVIGILMSSYG